MTLASLSKFQFELTNNRGDLEEAIHNSGSALAVLPMQHEQTTQTLDGVATFYRARFNMIKELVDLQTELKISQEMVEAVPISHQVRGAWLLDHMKRLKYYVWQSESLKDVDETIQQSEKLLKSMPDQYNEKLLNEASLGELVLRHYMLTVDIWELLRLIDYSEELSARDESLVVEIGHLESLQTAVAVIASVPMDMPEQAQAFKFLHDAIIKELDSGSLIHWLIRVQKKHNPGLAVYEASINNDRELAEHDIQRMLAIHSVHSKLKVGASSPMNADTTKHDNAELRPLASAPSNCQELLSMILIQYSESDISPSTLRPSESWSIYTLQY